MLILDYSKTLPCASLNASTPLSRNPSYSSVPLQSSSVTCRNLHSHIMKYLNRKVTLTTSKYGFTQNEAHLKMAENGNLHAEDDQKPSKTIGSQQASGGLPSEDLDNRLKQILAGSN